MNMSAGDKAALKAAQDIINRGQAAGDQSAVTAGMQAQSKVLADNGTVYQTGSSAAAPDPSVPLPKSWQNASGDTSYAAVAGKGSSAGAALANTMQSLYGPKGMYASALAAQQKANQASVDKAVGALEGQKQTTTQNYADMFRQLYQQKKNAQKNIGQQMAAQGVTGGASESTLLGLETGYAEALRQGQQGRADTLSELDRAITAARLDGDIANAQLAAESAREQTAGYAAVLQNLLNRHDNQQARQTAYEREDAANKLSYARQLALSIAQRGEMPTDELLASAGLSRADVEAIANSAAGDRGKEEETTTYARALEKAQTLAKYGDFSGYGALGYSAQEIAAMKTAYDKAVAAERAASAPKYTPKTYTATQAEQALKVALRGDTSDAVRAVIEGYYGLPMESVLAANGYEPAPEGLTVGSDSWSGDLQAVNSDIAAGKFGSKIMEVQDEVRKMVAAGRTAAQIGAWIDANYSEAEISGAGLEFIKYQLDLVGKGV